MIPKSVSPNVVPSKPRVPNTGSKQAGKNERSIPFTKEPATAPLTPPVALPYTPAVAPQKKCGTSPGTMTVKPNKGRRKIDTMPPAKLHKKPMITAFGANGKTVGASSAGFAPLTKRSAIPLKAGTISPIAIRTPAKIMYTPAKKGNSLNENEDSKVRTTTNVFYI